MEKNVETKDPKAGSGRILIVDDSSFMRGSLKVILEGGGYEIVGMAGDGEDALKKYKGQGPDLVTLDVLMEPVDGIATLASIMKADPAAKVVMVTAMGQEEMQERARRLGARGYIRKPFKPEEVVREIDRVLNAGETGTHDETNGQEA